MMIFPYRLKQLRCWKGITQVQLAEGLGVSQFSVSMWERGEQYPRPNMMQRIADYFEVRTEVLNEGFSKYGTGDVLSQWNTMYYRVAELSPERQILLLKVVEAFINVD